MAEPNLRHVTEGNETNYVLGTTEHGWGGFDVVGFRAHEAISAPFRYEITLVRSADSGPVDLSTLVDSPATLAIATLNRWRRVHGILAEAECLERTSEILLYRVLLVPHWWRARVRRHCRNFVNRTLREIISDVLANKSYENPEGLDGLSELDEEVTPPPEGLDTEHDFEAPTASFRWAVDVDARIRNRNLRSYVVQYNETDFDFVSRLLEEEGISYYFEHASDRLVMTLSDKPGSLPLFNRDERFTMRSVAGGLGREEQLEVIRSFHEHRGLRENQVTMRDYDWHRSHMVLEGTAKAPESTTASADYHAFPARDERIYDEPCETPAEVHMQRFDAAQQLARGTGTVRTMEPGYRFTVVDDAGLMEEGEYLTVSVQTSACQMNLETTEAEPARLGLHEGHGEREVPWHTCRFTVLDHEVHYRPPERAGKPRIHGIQTATVTAEEFESEQPEINADEHARVRVRFPWDERPENEGATSDWVRVSQGWAGPRYGALYHPRVGHEVLIAYLQGDPDRPLVVGRVYNVQNPPPYDGDAEPTKSTLKSQSSPDASGFNELRFEDLAGSEQIYLHAQKDLDERVNHDHTTDVGHDQLDTVGNDQTFRITHHQSTHVGGDQSIDVAHSRTLEVGDDETITIGADRIRSIGNDCKVSVGGSRSAFIVNDNSVSVGGNESLTVSGERRVLIETAESYTVSGKRIVKCEGIQRMIAGDRLVEIEGGSDVLTVSGERRVKAGQTKLTMDGTCIILDSGGGAVLKLDGDKVIIEAAKIKIEASAVCDIKGQPIKLNCS
jgi:type VI secretion system secreted protein VgrG